MMLDRLGDNRFHTISGFHLSKQSAENWIKLYDPKNERTLKIMSEKQDTKNFVESQQKELKQMIKKEMSKIELS